MPDRPQAEKTAKRKTSPPKRPPKELPQDYSSLPQRPIKLKSDVTLPPVLKRNTVKQRATKRSTPTPTKPKPQPKPKAKQRKSAQDPAKLLESLSPKAKEITIACAEKQKLEPIAWLERLILESQQHEAGMKESDAITNSLQTIEQRLERIEKQRGFWSRFWEYYIEPYRRQE